MLERFVVQNFKSLVLVNVPLRPLTVLIGKNDSGKSSFLRALKHFSGFSLKVDQNDYYRKDRSLRIQMQGTNTSGESFNLEQLPSIKRLPTSLYQLPALGVSMISEGYDDRSGAQPLGEDGSGVPSLLDYLSRRDRRRFERLLKEILNQVPGLNDIEITTPSANARGLDLVLENGFRMEADQASAGVRLLLFFAALTYHPSPPKLILLEEPENGIHPKRLEEVIRLLRAITQGTHGGEPAQVILTTHSPYLLDFIDLETDQVLIFRRNEDGSRSVEPADAKRLSIFLDEFHLGEVWYNQGEEGLVKR